MERKAKVRYEYGVYTEYPLFFWVQCCNCQKEFRRERLWRALTGPFCNGAGVIRYLCKSCVSTKDEAHKYFAGDKYIHKLLGDPPTFRPPPPKGQGIKRKELC